MTSIIAPLALSLQLFTVAPPPSRVSAVWVIDLDATASQSSGQFELLPGFARQAVLPLLQPGDTIVFLRMERAPGAATPEPETILLDSRTREFVRQVQQFDARLREVPRAGRDRTTDIGRLFDFARQGVELDKRTGTKRPWVLVGLSDGVPDGPQTTSARHDPVSDVDVRTLFLGTNPGVEPGLQALATKAGFNDPARALYAPHSHVIEMLDSIHRFLGRTANKDLVRKLGAPAKGANTSR